jgi:hypothetical protein
MSTRSVFDDTPGGGDLHTLISEARWQQAAERLNNWNTEGIDAALKELQPRAIESLYLGAVANDKVGEGSNMAKRALAASPELAKAREAIVAKGITMKEFVDATTKTNGQNEERYGFFRRLTINRAADAIDESHFAHLYMEPNRTNYLHASGRQGTEEEERSARLAEVKPRTGLGAVAEATARAVTNDPKIIDLAGASGDLAETGLSGVAPRSNYKSLSTPDTRPIPSSVSEVAQRNTANAPSPGAQRGAGAPQVQRTTSTLGAIASAKSPETRTASAQSESGTKTPPAVATQTAAPGTNTQSATADNPTVSKSAQTVSRSTTGDAAKTVTGDKTHTIQVRGAEARVSNPELLAQYERRGNQILPEKIQETIAAERTTQGGNSPAELRRNRLSQLENAFDALRAKVGNATELTSEQRDDFNKVLREARTLANKEYKGLQPKLMPRLRADATLQSIEKQLVQAGDAKASETGALQIKVVHPDGSEEFQPLNLDHFVRKSDNPWLAKDSHNLTLTDAPQNQQYLEALRKHGKIWPTDDRERFIVAHQLNDQRVNFAPGTPTGSGHDARAAAREVSAKSTAPPTKAPAERGEVAGVAAAQSGSKSTAPPTKAPAERGEVAGVAAAQSGSKSTAPPTKAPAERGEVAGVAAAQSGSKSTAPPTKAPTERSAPAPSAGRADSKPSPEQRNPKTTPSMP